MADQSQWSFSLSCQERFTREYVRMSVCCCHLSAQHSLQRVPVTHRQGENFENGSLVDCYVTSCGKYRY